MDLKKERIKKNHKSEKITNGFEKRKVKKSQMDLKNIF